MHARGGFLRDAADRVLDLRPAAGVLLDLLAELSQERAELFGVVRGVELGNRTGLLELEALEHHHRGVAAVVEDQVAGLALPVEDLAGAPPVLVERLALPGEHGHALRVVGRAVGTNDNRSRGGVIGREDVAARPADLGAELGQRLDQHGGLHGHVQRAGDAGALERLLAGVLATQRHQARHLVLGKTQQVPAGLGQVQVRDLVVEGAVGVGGQVGGGQCGHGVCSYVALSGRSSPSVSLSIRNACRGNEQPRTAGIGLGR